MAKSVEQLNQQIAKLQQQVELAKAREAEGVIKRIREAVEHYGLTPEQIFGTGSGRRTRGAVLKAATAGKRKVGTPSTRSGKSSSKPVSRTSGVGVPGGKGRSPLTGIKVPPKFADDQGNTWTGRGNTPRWLKEAIASGKTKEDFAIKA